MVQSQAHVVECVVTITLPAGSYSDFSFAADGVTIEAQTITDLPAQSRMQVGYPSMGATFTLSGLVDLADGKKTAGWLFRRYNTASPLYRSDALAAPVTIDVGLYPVGSLGAPELIRKFTGFVDSYVEQEDGSVQFTCIDKRTTLRSIPDTPAVVTAPPYNARLTSEYALDAVLRAARPAQDISSWPAQRPSCVLAAGMRSSMWPEVGAIYSLAGPQLEPYFAAGAFGSAFSATSASLGGRVSAVYTTATPLGTSVFIEFWVTGTFFPISVGVHSDASYAAGVPLLTCQVDANGLSVTPNPVVLGGSAFTWTTATDGSTHYIAFKVTLPASGGTSWSATAYKDGSAASSGALSFSTARNSDDWYIISAKPQSGTIEALQVTTETSPALNNGFTPKAVLDPSLNTLQVIPEVSGDPWAVIQQIGDAELGVAGFDESGIFRFYNRNTIKSAGSVRDITTAESMQVETTSAAVINRGQVGYTAWNYGAPAVIWSLDSVWRIPKRSIGKNVFVRYATVTDGSLFTSVDTTLTFMNDAGTTTAGNSYYRTSIDAAGTSDHPGVTIVLIQVSSTRVRIEITNRTSRDCYLVASADHPAPAAGTPVLIIGGTPVTQANESQTDYQYPAAVDGGAASSRFGEVAWQATGNPWIQDADSAQQLAQDVVLDGYVPRPNLTNITIIPDPRLQLIDVVHLVDPDTTFVDEYARIFGWTLTLSHDSWSMTIDARTVAPPGAWILGVPGRSELAQTTYLQGV